MVFCIVFIAGVMICSPPAIFPAMFGGNDIELNGPGVAILDVHVKMCLIGRIGILTV